MEHRLKGVGGTIEISLYASLQDLDAPLALAAKMNDILGWDIDFSRDLRQGDTFRILYEEVWKDGEFVRTGAIQAAGDRQPRPGPPGLPLHRRPTAGPATTTPRATTCRSS